MNFHCGSVPANRPSTPQSTEISKDSEQGATYQEQVGRFGCWHGDDGEGEIIGVVGQQPPFSPVYGGQVAFQKKPQEVQVLQD